MSFWRVSVTDLLAWKDREVLVGPTPCLHSLNLYYLLILFSEEACL